MNNDKYLVSIIGPTAVGKTKMCVDLAEYFMSEIISADSRQFYKEMSIGTAKPTDDEMRGIKHHFVNCLSIHEEMSAGKFEREALALIEELFKKNNLLILTGGSGMYLQAVIEGFSEMPDIAPGIRENLMIDVENNRKHKLLEELYEKDPEYYEKVDTNNTQRVVRALEVIRGTGKTFTSFRNKSKQKVNRPFNIIKIGLEREREALYERINGRMDKMIEDGLEKEARNLYPWRHLNALQTVGYTEWFDYFEGKYDREEAVRLLKRNSRRYAKRQMTWFKRDPEINWFHPGDKRAIVEFIEDKISHNNGAAAH